MLASDPDVEPGSAYERHIESLGKHRMSTENEYIAPPPAPTGTPPEDQRTLALITHLSGIVLGFIVPLIIWLVNKDQAGKDFINDQSKEALNFQITLLIVYVIGIVLSIILIGALINEAFSRADLLQVYQGSRVLGLAQAANMALFFALLIAVMAKVGVKRARLRAA